MIRNEGDRLRQVIVCTPRVEYARGASELEKHNIGELGDPEEAIRQHDGLKATLRAFGAEVLDVPELARHPNSVFTRDTSLCTPRGYVQLRLGLETRRGEGAWMAEVLDGLGVPRVGEILAPGTVEGGDVVLAGDVAFVGRSIRTNEEGIGQLSALLEPMGYEMRIIGLPPTILHLDKVLMALGPRQVLVCADLVPVQSTDGFDRIEIPCGGHTTANIICLGDGEIVTHRTNEGVITRLTAAGYKVHVRDLGEFAKGMGGPNCLILPVRRETW
jgi:dimethylargininase